VPLKFTAITKASSFCWVKTVFRYDGGQFTNLPFAKRGQHNTMIVNDDGHIWLGGYGSGLLRSDGVVAQPLNSRHGLPYNSVQCLYLDRDGDYWIASEGGLTLMRPSRIPPHVRLDDVVTDARHGPEQTLQIPATSDYLRVEFSGRSMDSPAADLAYVYRVVGLRDDWQGTRERFIEFQDLPLGEYVIEVKAVDLEARDEASVSYSYVQPPYKICNYHRNNGLKMS